MKVLLDTHALLWWLADDDRLGSQARGLIADPAHDIIVSVASLWEIVVKVRVGKLQAEIEAVYTSIEQDGFRLLDLSRAHFVALSELPSFHRDPFDHLLMAQALVEAATFLSDDRRVARYPVHLLTCSDQSSP